MNKQSQQGFTLLELAIVFIIIGVLLSYTFMPARAQLESGRIKEARAKLVEIEEALYGFAIANGRMPCPTFPNKNGQESPTNPVAYCDTYPGIAGYIGFVPTNTLGLKGEVNCDGLLIDPWGSPYYYSVTNADTTTTEAIFIVSNAQGILNAGGPAIASVAADIKVCNDLSAACNSGANSSIDNAVAVIFSTATRQRNNSNEENVNAGEGASIASTCSLPAYKIGSDEFYYSAQRVEKANNEFDDIVSWISPNILYAKLLQARYTLQ